MCRVFLHGSARAEMGDGEALPVAKASKDSLIANRGCRRWYHSMELSSGADQLVHVSGAVGRQLHIDQASEDTPLSALYIGKLAIEAGFPAGVINVLPGRGEITGQAIAEHPGIRYISFTGSPGVGQSIMRTCDVHGTRMKREMGGNGAAIVLADADPQMVARLIGKYTNQHYGQTCCTIHRVFVDKKIADDFIDAQKEFLQRIEDRLSGRCRHAVGRRRQFHPTVADPASLNRKQLSARWPSDPQRRRRRSRRP